MDLLSDGHLPAFPSTVYNHAGIPSPGESHSGISVRMFLAGQALQGILSGFYSQRDNLTEFMQKKIEVEAAELALHHADRLIKMMGAK
jgi:hypothetical protein